MSMLSALIVLYTILSIYVSIRLSWWSVMSILSALIVLYTILSIYVSIY